MTKKKAKKVEQAKPLGIKQGQGKPKSKEK
jgi:hypothetical protein